MFCKKIKEVTVHHVVPWFQLNDRNPRLTFFSFFNTGSRNLPVKIQRVPIVKRTERGNHRAVTFRDLLWNVFCVSDQSLCSETLCQSQKKKAAEHLKSSVFSLFFSGWGMKDWFLGGRFQEKRALKPCLLRQNAALRERFSVQPSS